MFKAPKSWLKEMEEQQYSQLYECETATGRRNKLRICIQWNKNLPLTVYQANTGIYNEANHKL